MDGFVTNSEAERDAADGGQALPATRHDGSEGGEGGLPASRAGRVRRAAGPSAHPGAGAKIDLSAISLAALVDQLVAALRQAPAKMPLGQKGDWVVMAAWLVQLRARLLLPADAPAGQEAQVEADQLRGRLVALEDMQALAGWLERRPQLGHDVFVRGRPEVLGVSVEAGQAIDVVEFLWASLALFDDGTAAADTATVYQARPFELYQVAEARERILRLSLRRRTAHRSSGSCRRHRKSPTVNPIVRCGGARLGPARSSPVWNWPSRGMWCWGRGGISSPFTLPGLSPRRRSPWPQSAGSVVLRSGVCTVPVPEQTGQVTRLPPTTSTPDWLACK
jgi:hypothetical protein